LLVDTVTIERSLTNLIVTRALFFETIAVPTLFALSLFVPFARFERLRLWVFASFVIYLGVITGTDFTSFRQTLPFMPTMGLLVVHGWLELREGRGGDTRNPAEPPPPSATAALSVVRTSDAQTG
jgi:hypothetical protein